MMLQAFWIFAPEQNLCIMQCLKCLNWIIGHSVRFITWRLSQNISQHNGKTLSRNCYLTPLLHTYCSILLLKQAFLFCIYLNSLPINNFLTNGFSSCLRLHFVRSVVSGEPESLWQYDIPNSQIMTYGPSLV